jgi:hypothetical protein
VFSLDILSHRMSEMRNISQLFAEFNFDPLWLLTDANFKVPAKQPFLAGFWSGFAPRTRVDFFPIIHS